ncbi:hypothetical protein GGF32_006781 [Allomyces javanicus]|nr:hypothetical protein GGF32_006781 [Allomyces javanicus]
MPKSKYPPADVVETVPESSSDLDDDAIEQCLNEIKQSKLWTQNRTGRYKRDAPKKDPAAVNEQRLAALAKAREVRAEKLAQRKADLERNKRAKVKELAERIAAKRSMRARPAPPVSDESPRRKQRVVYVDESSDSEPAPVKARPRRAPAAKPAKAKVQDQINMFFGNVLNSLKGYAGMAGRALIRGIDYGKRVIHEKVSPIVGTARHYSGMVASLPIPVLSDIAKGIHLASGLVEEGLARVDPVLDSIAQYVIKPLDNADPRGAPSLIPTPSFSCAVVAARGSGKTNMMLNMVTRFYRRTFGRIVVCCPSFHSDEKWKLLFQPILRVPRRSRAEARLFQDHIEDNEPDPRVPSEADVHTSADTFEQVIRALIDDQLETRPKDRKTLIDCVMNGRHYKISTLYVTQSYFQLAKALRLNTTNFMLYSTGNQKEIASFYQEHHCGKTWDHWRAIYDHCVAETYSFLHVNYKNDNEHKLVKRFEAYVN